MGIMPTAVTPPAAAALRPVSRVSAASPPGTRRCTCISVAPGISHNPDGPSDEGSTVSMPSLETVMSARASVFDQGSRILMPRILRVSLSVRIILPVVGGFAAVGCFILGVVPSFGYYPPLRG